MTEFNINLALENGVGLDMLLFKDSEHKWLFSYDYRSPTQERLEIPDLINKTKLGVRYERGISQEVKLSMDIKRPKERGKVYYLGVDISSNSHLYIEFLYEKKDKFYKMRSIEYSDKKIDLDEIPRGSVIKPFDFPFPVNDRIENDFGLYSVPFLLESGEISHFEFPEDYRRFKEKK